MFYLVKTPWLLRKIYHSYEWRVDTQEKKVYLSFDDGPHPEITSFVLRQLKQFNALATFFCIGKNVINHPGVYRQIQEDGHSVGNHTFNHLNGWKTDKEIYLRNITEASAVINSPLFRPPYGRIRSSQVKGLKQAMKRNDSRVIMWDVLSGDFDESLAKEKCLTNVTKNGKQGSIVVFHDSEKAFKKLEYALPRTLEFFTEKGYCFSQIEHSANHE